MELQLRNTVCEVEMCIKAKVRSTEKNYASYSKKCNEFEFKAK